VHRTLQLGLLLIAAASCVASLPAPLPVAQPEGAFTEVPYPPPPARPEIVPDRPEADVVWIDGEWSWQRRRWAWILGRWLVPPAPEARFAAAAWRRDKSGKLWWAPGSWYDSRGARLPHPDPLAMADADEGDVIDAAGHEIDVGPNRSAHRRPRGVRRAQQRGATCSGVGEC
jgi:hypothetical protein